MLAALALGLQDHGFAVVMLDAEVVIAVPIRSSRCCGAVANPGEEHSSEDRDLPADGCETKASGRVKDLPAPSPAPSIALCHGRGTEHGADGPGGRGHPRPGCR